MSNPYDNKINQRNTNNDSSGYRGNSSKFKTQSYEQDSTARISKFDGMKSSYNDKHQTPELTQEFRWDKLEIKNNSCQELDPFETTTYGYTTSMMFPKCQPDVVGKDDLIGGIIFSSNEILKNSYSKIIDFLNKNSLEFRLHNRWSIFINSNKIENLNLNSNSNIEQYVISFYYDSNNNKSVLISLKRLSGKGFEFNEFLNNFKEYLLKHNIVTIQNKQQKEDNNNNQVEDRLTWFAEDYVSEDEDNDDEEEENSDSGSDTYSEE